MWLEQRGNGALAGEVSIHGLGPYLGFGLCPDNYGKPLKDLKQENGMTRLTFQSDHPATRRNRPEEDRSRNT